MKLYFSESFAGNWVWCTDAAAINIYLYNLDVPPGYKIAYLVPPQSFRMRHNSRALHNLLSYGSGKPMAALFTLATHDSPAACVLRPISVACGRLIGHPCHRPTAHSNLHTTYLLLHCGVTNVSSGVSRENFQ